MDEVRARCLSNVISVLLEQRKIVVSRGATFAGHLIDLTVMQLRLTIHEISEEELSEFSKDLSNALWVLSDRRENKDLNQLTESNEAHSSEIHRLKQRL